MEIILSPNEGNSNQLREVYQRALKGATELYIATAYLTLWDRELAIGSGCKYITFLIGTDFGLSRKSAMRDALRWLPKDGNSSLVAVPSNNGYSFHPKLLIWKSKDNKYYSLTGSSNLTRAAFDNNYEANAYSSISRDTFDEAKSWLNGIVEDSIPITNDWINNHYKESSLVGKNRKNLSGDVRKPVKLSLPSGKEYRKAVLKRRKQQRAFSEIDKSITNAVYKCANRKIVDLKFWSTFWDIWSGHQSRFQGSGLQITGKKSVWNEACKSLAAILDASKAGSRSYDLDRIVAAEIDRLRKLKNPARGAWLSEMLCHYFPDLYPVKNLPIKKWFKAMKWTGTRGATEGRLYLDMAKQLRYVLKSKPAGAKNLAELDQVIWLWDQKRMQREERHPHTKPHA